MSILLDALRQQSKAGGKKPDSAASPAVQSAPADKSAGTSHVQSVVSSSPLMDDEFAALKVEPPAFLDWRLQGKPDAHATTSESPSADSPGMAQEQPEPEPLAFTLEPSSFSSGDAEADLLFPEVTSDADMLPLSAATSEPENEPDASAAALSLAMEPPPVTQTTSPSSGSESAPLSGRSDERAMPDTLSAPSPRPVQSEESDASSSPSRSDRGDGRPQQAATFLGLAHPAMQNEAPAMASTNSAPVTQAQPTGNMDKKVDKKATHKAKTSSPRKSASGIALPVRPVVRKAAVLVAGVGLLSGVAFYGWLAWQTHEQQFVQDMASVQDPTLSEQVNEELARHDAASSSEPDAIVADATASSVIPADGSAAMANTDAVQVQPLEEGLPVPILADKIDKELPVSRRAAVSQGDEARKPAPPSVSRAVVARADATEKVASAPVVSRPARPAQVASPRASTVPIVTEPAHEQSGVYRSLAVSDLLDQAYRAWQSGEVATAERHYRQILEGQPAHRQALLGMLAVAQIQQNTAQMSALMDRLLQLYPRDADVQTAMLSLQGMRRDGWESELKQMVARHPQNPQVHFLLGAFFASEKRWSEAQSAFFSAVSVDPQQPEYLANLAIALDQLGKGGLAATYYQQALDATRLRPSHLNQEQIQRRLQYLLAREGG